MSSTITANDTVASGFKRYRLAGVQIASLEQQQASQEQSRENFSQALQDGRLDVSKLRSPSSPVIPVYVDDDGQQFLGIPTALGPRMYPLENAVPFDHEGNPGAGGFWSADAINELKNAPGAGNPQAMASLMTQAAQRVLPQSAGSDGASLVESFLTSTGMGIGQQLASEGLSMLAGASNPNGVINQFVAAGTGAGLAQLGQSLASGLIGNVMNMGIQAAMSGWKVDDESSTAEHVAQQAAKALIGKLQAELMSMVDKELSKAFGNAAKDQLAKPGDSPTTMDKIKEFFAGPTSAANNPALRVSDCDMLANPVTSCSSNVVIEGLQAARESDFVAKAGANVYNGAKTVSTNSMPAGRAMGAEAPSMSEVGYFLKGAATIFVGGAATGTVPPVNSSASAATAAGSATGAATPAANDGTGPDSKKTLPGGQVYDESTGTVYDPKTGETMTVPKGVEFDPTTGQFFQLDGEDGIPIDPIKDRRNWDFERGWSSTPRELESNWLPELPDRLRNVFRAESNGTSILGIPQREGNWYLFGGLIDLGSPQWPGAGTGSPAWLAPDRILFWDMSDYFVFHDWHFNPDSLGNIGQILTTEAEAFGAGASFDPIQMALQVIYSGATTIAGVTTAASNDIQDAFD